MTGIFNKVISEHDLVTGIRPVKTAEIDRTPTDKYFRCTDRVIDLSANNSTQTQSARNETLPQVALSSGNYADVEYVPGNIANNYKHFGYRGAE